MGPTPLLVLWMQLQESGTAMPPSGVLGLDARIHVLTKPLGSWRSETNVLRKMLFCDAFFHCFFFFFLFYFLKNLHTLIF